MNDDDDLPGKIRALRKEVFDLKAKLSAATVRARTEDATRLRAELDAIHTAYRAALGEGVKAGVVERDAMGAYRIRGETIFYSV